MTIFPISLLGVKIHPLTRPALRHFIAQSIHSNARVLALNVNVYAMNLAYENPWLRRFFNQSGITFTDGAGVIFAAKLLGRRIPERVTYADWMWELASIAEEEGYTLFFLGAEPSVAEQAAARLRQRFPKIKIVGVRHGYFDKNPQSAENAELVAAINQLRPNILITGMGMPIQERWLMENWERLNVNIFLTGGAVFDYISGKLSRAPRWMTENGLEWLGRLLIEPRRLWKRYILGNPLFLWRIFTHEILGFPLPKRN